MHRSTLVRAMRAAGLAAMTSAALAPGADAAGASLFKTLNTTATGSQPGGMLDTGTAVYFRATTPESGTELWRSTEDGTASLVANIAQGGSSSNPAVLTKIDDLVYFTAYDSEHGVSRVYSTAGTPATTHALTPEDQNLATVKILHVGDTVFALSSTGIGSTLHRLNSDGTTTVVGSFDIREIAALPTALVATDLDGKVWSIDESGDITEIESGDGSFDGATEIIGSGSFAYFVYRQPGNPGATGLWVTDGSSAQEVLIEDSSIANIENLVPRAGGGAIFGGVGNLYAASDDASVSFVGNGPSIDYPLVSAGSKVFYPSYDNELGGSRLYVNDGSEESSTLVDFGPLEFAKIKQLTRVGDHVVFAASVDGESLVFQSDGTPGGTFQLSSSGSFPGMGAISEIAPRPDGSALFAGTSTIYGNELFATDPQATADDHGSETLVADVDPAHAAGAVTSDAATEFGDHKVLFSAYDGHVTQPWISDGTSAGTHRLNPELEGSAYLSSAVAVGDRAFFVVDDESPSGKVLHTTDGTSESIVSAAAGGDAPGAKVSQLVASGDAAYYLANGEEGSDSELYRTSGDAGEVVNHPEIWPGNSVPRHIAAGPNGTLYVHLTDSIGEVDRGLWILDPVSGESTRVLDGDETRTTLDGALLVDGKLYFLSTTPEAGQEAWVTDGTAAGTHMLGELTAGSDDGAGRNVGQPFAHAGNQVFVYGYDGNANDGDGSNVLKQVTAGELTPAQLPEEVSPWDLREFVPAGNRLFVMTYGGLLVFNADGSSTALGEFGTYQIGNLRAVGSRVYFSARNEEQGNELWTSDGTVAGTRLAADVAPGLESSDPTNLFSAGGTLLFGAYTPDTNRQLFSFDTTTDVNPPATTPPATTPEYPGEEEPTTPEPTTPEATTPPVDTPPVTTPPIVQPDPPAKPNPTPPAGVPTPTPPVTAPDTRAVPRKATATVTNKTDTKAPYKYKLAGSLLGAKGLAKKSECTGSADIEISSQARTGGKLVKTVIKTYRTKLKWVDGECGFDKEITLPKNGLPKSGKVQATVIFPGTKNQQPKSSKPITLRFG